MAAELPADTEVVIIKDRPVPCTRADKKDEPCPRNAWLVLQASYLL